MHTWARRYSKNTATYILLLFYINTVNAGFEIYSQWNCRNIFYCVWNSIFILNNIYYNACLAIFLINHYWCYPTTIFTIASLSYASKPSVCFNWSTKIGLNTEKIWNHYLMEIWIYYYAKDATSKFDQSSLRNS